MFYNTRAMSHLGLACLATLAGLLPSGKAARGAGSPADRVRSDLLARVGEARYRLALLRPGGGDLGESLRALSEARDLDPANLRALGYLGLARFEAATRGAAAGFEDDAFAEAREPLEELFRLSGGWAAPSTRELLADVGAALDRALGDDGAAPENARAWWSAWRKRLVSDQRPAPPAARGLPLVEALRQAPVAWERERAAEELAHRAPPAPATVEALGVALRVDASPWVRSAAARAIAALAPPGWDVLLADALRNDPSVWVRRTCAEALGADPARLRSPERTRGALLGALAGDTARVAAAAARSLGRIGGAGPELVAALESSSPLLRRAAAGALVRHSEAASIAAMARPLLDAGRAEVRAAALRALGSGPGHLPLEMLDRACDLLVDHDARVRGAAANVFLRRDVGGAHDRLLGLLTDEDLSVRLTAAEALLAAGDEAALPVLEALAESRIPLTAIDGRGEVSTIGEAARRTLSERRKENGTPSAPRE